MSYHILSFQRLGYRHEKAFSAYHAKYVYAFGIDQDYQGSLIKHIMDSGLSRELVSVTLELLAD